MTLVGEKGPELVNLPRGSQVIPNDALRQGGAGGAIVYSPAIDARGASVEAVARLAQIMEADGAIIRHAARWRPSSRRGAGRSSGSCRPWRMNLTDQPAAGFPAGPPVSSALSPGTVDAGVGPSAGQGHGIAAVELRATASRC